MSAEPRHPRGSTHWTWPGWHKEAPAGSSLGEPAGALVAEQAVEVEGLIEVHSIHEVGQLPACQEDPEVAAEPFGDQPVLGSAEGGCVR
jgi:hypothetical protein